jgi:hypothetical protein
VVPGIDLEKATNGEDADQPPGPGLPAGAPVVWTYQVTNTGNAPLAAVTVVDDQGVIVVCPGSTLAVGASMVCVGQGVARGMGGCVGEECPPPPPPYANVGTATGTAPDGQVVSDSDPSHYHVVVGPGIR